jgi:predicted phosphodiesterase
MKIKFCSDLHLERAAYTINNDDNSDILILAGDICQASDLCTKKIINQNVYTNRLNTFFQHCSDEFKNVIYVVGNHEHYSYDFNKTVPDIKHALSKYKNIHVLQNESIEIGGFVIIGTTLWTDLNNSDSITMITIPIYLNDYRLISKGSSNFKPKDSLASYKKSVKFIKNAIKNADKPYIVVTHHLPSFNSLHEQYRQYTIVNGAWYSELSPLIQDNPQIKLWISGHTHLRHSYYINETLFACNPRGYYGSEIGADTFIPITLEMDKLPNSNTIHENNYWNFYPNDI